MIFLKAEEDNCSPDSLKKLRVDKPNGTSKGWKPIPHHDLLMAIERTCEGRGWKTRNMKCLLGPYKTRMATSFDVIGPPPPKPGTMCSLGIYNAMNQSSRIWLYAGLRLTEEDTGMAFTKISLGRHKKSLAEHLDERCRAVLDLYENATTGFSIRIAKLQRRTLSIEQSLRIVFRAGKEVRLSDTLLGRLQKSLGQQETGWEVLLKFAKEVKKSSPLAQMELLYNFLTKVLKG